MKNIRGRVLEQDAGRPIADLLVRLAGCAEGEGSAAVTDAEGRFELEMPPSVDYRGVDRDVQGVAIVVEAPEVFSTDAKTLSSAADRVLLTVDLDETKEAWRSLILEVPKDRLARSGTGQDAMARSRMAEARKTASVRQALKKRGRLVAAIVGSSPVAMRGRALFVPPGTDATAQLEVVRSRGLQRLNGLADRLRGARIPISPDLLRTLSPEFRLDDTGNLIAAPDALSHAAIHRSLRVRSGSLEWNGALDDAGCLGVPPDITGIDLSSRGEGVGSTSGPADDGADGAVAPTPGDTGGLPAPDSIDGTPEDAVASATPDLAALVDAGIRSRLLQMDGAVASSGVRPDVTTLEAELGRRQLASGPADVPVLHDFHKLSIAFENVWTASVDRNLREGVASLYAQVVQVEKDTGIQPPDDPAEEETSPFETGEFEHEIENLEDLIASLRDRIDIAEAVTAPVDDDLEVLNWYPAFWEVWADMSHPQRVRARFIRWVARYLSDWMGYRADHSDERHRSLDDLDGEVLPNAEAGAAPGPRSWKREVTLGELTWTWPEDKADEIVRSVANERATPPTDEAPPSSIGRARRLLAEISHSMARPYQFDVFVPDSYNFGIVTTYRQRWTPLTYQAGELVASLPLAPGEKRTFQKKTVIRKTRARKELEKAVSTRRSESESTSRAESEILKKASHSTNFQLNSEGSFNIELVDVSVGHQFGGDTGGESQQTKKDFREAVQKASHEYRSERSLEVSTEHGFEGTTTETGEISNPNSEITVTYLFYQLQRRFRVSEALHRVTPVILWAFDVPRPDEIDETWMLEHDWVLRRVLLDDRLEQALDYLSDTFTGDEVGISVLRSQWEAQMAVVSELKMNFQHRASFRNQAREALAEATRRVSNEGFMESLVEKFLMADIANEDPEVIAAKRDAAARVLEWADSDFTQAEGRLAESLDTLRVTTDRYVQALRAQLNRRTAIDQLKLHVKQNILYYMQAIWSHEPADQRYFRLYDKKVRDLESGGDCTVDAEPEAGEPQLGPDCLLHSTQYIHVKCGAPTLGAERELHEVADLDRLLGFKGNYAIFPLRESNGITNFMMQDYVDLKYGLRDPDPMALVARYQDGLMKEQILKGLADSKESRPLLEDIIARSAAQSEVIVVPTDSLFIEALPGAHPLLEDFKLRHRAIDVEKARAEVRQTDMETLRYAARMAAGQHGDPEIEKQVVIKREGGGDADIDVNVDVDPDA